MNHKEVDLLAIGAGPSNLALAIALEELAPELATSSLIIEQHKDVAWQRGMLLPWAQSQVSFLKDLVTLRNPRSQFTFINYLHSVGRLDQFVNLATFTPYRAEISAYLQWVARSLTTVRIEYGQRCVGIQPLRSASGIISAWLVRLADDSTISCRNLVLGTGRDPRIPDVFAAVPKEHLIHSAEYTSRMAELDQGLPRTAVVVGSAQSAAEMLLDTYQGMPRTRCIMVMRTIGLQSYEHSKFTNELYYPPFVDDFFMASEPVRRQVLSEMRRTNYGALDPELLETLYRQVYLERLSGSDRLQIITMTDIAEAWPEESGITLTLVDRKDGRKQKLHCDVVMLGTGFSESMPAIASDLAAAIGLAEIRISRRYAMVLPGKVTAGCYLQGVNEATHGISDSLMSVLALRAQDIVTDIVTRDRGERPAAYPPPWDELADPPPGSPQASSQAQASYPAEA